MKSLLLSALVQKFATRPLEELERAHPHDWLLWEPGSWKPVGAGPTMMVPVVVAQTEPHAGEGLGIELPPTGKPPPPCTLGRGTECQLVLNDATLSTVHLTFLWVTTGKWTVSDMGSKNGSWLDKKKLLPFTATELEPGASLQAGRVSLTYYTPPTMLRRLQESSTRPRR